MLTHIILLNENTVYLNPIHRYLHLKNKSGDLKKIAPEKKIKEKETQHKYTEGKIKNKQIQYLVKGNRAT